MRDVSSQWIHLQILASTLVIQNWLWKAIWHSTKMKNWKPTLQCTHLHLCAISALVWGMNTLATSRKQNNFPWSRGCLYCMLGGIRLHQERCLIKLKQILPSAKCLYYFWHSRNRESSKMPCLNLKLFEISKRSYANFLNVTVGDLPLFWSLLHEEQ